MLRTRQKCVIYRRVSLSTLGTTERFFLALSGRKYFASFATDMTDTENRARKRGCFPSCQSDRSEISGNTWRKWNDIFRFRNSHANNSNVTATDNLNTFSNNFTRTQTLTHRRNRRKRKPRNINSTIRLDTTSVINLSQTPLSHDESSVLARGLTFCPTPRRINYQLTLMNLHDGCDLLSTFMITTIALLSLLIIKITHSIIKAHGFPPLTETRHLTRTLSPLTLTI